MKYILVSGTSSGIGRACAEFLSENYHVFATLRSKEDAKKLGFIDNPDITPILLDLTRTDEIKNAVQMVCMH
jgi:NAD(P)-dependent dehydrogenase (short-subunit alcohol dehydrogenase family)